MVFSGNELPPSGSCVRLGVFQPPVQQVVLPDAVDAKIVARIALTHKAGIFQEPDRRGVGGDAGRFQTMQPQRRECEGNNRLYRRGHVAVAYVGQAHPIAEAAGLRYAASDIGERQSANQRVVGVAADQEGVALVGPQILGIPPDPPAEGGPAEIVSRPSRLPGGEKVAALLAQRRPFAVVGHLRRA